MLLNTMFVCSDSIMLINFYREALHEASDELVEEVVEDKDVSSFGERLSCDDTSATLLNC